MSFSFVSVKKSTPAHNVKKAESSSHQAKPAAETAGSIALFNAAPAETAGSIASTGIMA